TAVTVAAAVTAAGVRAMVPMPVRARSAAKVAARCCSATAAPAEMAVLPGRPALQRWHRYRQRLPDQ
ncbi:hypothetical protein OSI85_25150, partial [Mycobacterium ulcerans]